MDLAHLRTRLASGLEGREDVDLALLFGSHARGQARPTSDVDVAVIGRSIDTIGLAIELTDALGTPVDVVDLSGDPPIALLLEILRDGIKIRERSPGAYGRFLSHTLLILETDLPAHRAMQRAFVHRVAQHGLSG